MGVKGTLVEGWKEGEVMTDTWDKGSAGKGKLFGMKCIKNGIIYSFFLFQLYFSTSPPFPSSL